MADDNSVNIRFGASTDDAIAGIEQIRAALSDLTAPVNDVNSNVARLTAAFGRMLPADAIAQIAKGFGDVGSQAQRSAGQLKEISAEIKLLHMGLAQQKVVLNAEAAQFQITQNQKFSMLEDETQKEYEAELALLEQKAALGNLSVNKRNEVLAQIAELEVKHHTDMIKLDAQAIAQQQQTWTKLLSPIESAWDSQLRSLLAGTESFGKAMKKVFADLVLDGIKQFEKLALMKPLENLLSGQPGGIAGGGTLLGALSGKGAGDNAGLLGAAAAGLGKLFSGTSGATQAAATAANTTASAAASAGEAAAGAGPQSLLGGLPGAGQAATTANTTALGVLTASIDTLNVTMGGEAAASAGGAAASAGGGLFSGFSKLFSLFGIAALDVGGYVMGSGLAMIHSGEMVVPARVQTPFQGGGGGDTHVHNWSISAVDATSMQRWLGAGGADQIARSIQGVRSRSPSMSW
jgi:hypothetical protein